MQAERIPAVLSIATSDSGGGAGIQADLKSFARSGVHGMTAIVGLTAQSTTEVSSIEQASPEMVIDQVRTVAADIGVDAAKTGMLGTAATIEAVVEALGLIPRAPLVVDPVMVAESGAVLLEPAARTVLIDRLLPLAAVVTPNLGEARVLAGIGPDADAEELARAIHALGPDAVVVTGGHTEDGADLFFDGERIERIEGDRHPDGAAHGSGCTHSAALAAHLALGLSPLDAARAARAIASEAVGAGLNEIGRGVGPVDALGVRARARERQ